MNRGETIVSFVVGALAIVVAVGVAQTFRVDGRLDELYGITADIRADVRELKVGMENVRSELVSVNKTLQSIDNRLALAPSAGPSEVAESEPDTADADEALKFYRRAIELFEGRGSGKKPNYEEWLRSELAKLESQKQDEE